ncbi:hypothetical protein D9M71_582860 [compost metagenome]
MHAVAADELPEGGSVGQPAGSAPAKQAVGHGVRGEKKGHTETTIEVEEPEELVADRRDQPPVQVLVDRCENIHERLPPAQVERWVGSKNAYRWGTACRR